MVLKAWFRRAPFRELRDAVCLSAAATSPLGIFEVNLAWIVAVAKLLLLEPLVNESERLPGAYFS
jgi:hypothetical protein